jgi:hypothetical protein
MDIVLTAGPKSTMSLKSALPSSSDKEHCRPTCLRRLHETESGACTSRSFALALPIGQKYLVARLYGLCDEFRYRRENHEASPHLALLKSPKHEFNTDTEVLARASQAPEEVLVLGGGSFDDATIRKDHGALEKVVDNKTVLDGEPAEAAAKSQSTDSRVCNRSTDSCETVFSERSVNFAPGRTATDLDDLLLGVDIHVANVCVQVDEEAAVS